VWVAALGIWATAARAQTSNLVDLGAGTGHDLNNSGQVALDEGIYSGGTITPLPALPGQSTPASALAINASGKVVGSAITPTGASATLLPVAVLYDGATLTNLVSGLPGISGLPFNGAAEAIDASGKALGWFVFTDSIHNTPTKGFTYTGGTLTPMVVPCTPASASDCTNVAYNTPHDLNDSGQIVGEVRFNLTSIGTQIVAYVEDNGTWTDLGPGASFAINSGGQVTGTLATAGGTSAFIYANGTTTSLGTLPGGANSIGYDINATGQVVGSSDFNGGAATHAFFYNGLVIDLNDIISSTDALRPFVTLTRAVAINDNRLILANGIDSRTHDAHAYLLQGPWINVAPGALAFGSAAVGATSPPQNVVISNGGTHALSLDALSASANFVLQTNGCATSLGSGEQCTVAVAFAPTVAGAASGTVSIPAAGTNYSVTLSGVAPITATLTSGSATATVGSQITLTWAASPGSTCTASTDVGSNFTGSIAASGTKSFTESAAGAVSYGIHCTAPGTTQVDRLTTVTWSWPPVTTTLAAAPTTITAGDSATLTWSSSNATSCTASGGTSGDGWAGTLATTGSRAVTPPGTAAATLTYGVTCTSSASNLSGQASAGLTVNSAPRNGGGGAFDLLSLVALLGAWWWRVRCLRNFPPRYCNDLCAGQRSVDWAPSGAVMYAGLSATSAPRMSFNCSAFTVFPSW